MDLFQVVPSYPIKERENWRTLTMESESGIEERATKWAYPKREWDLIWNQANRTSETDSIRNFLNKTRGGATSFIWREPYLTTRERVLIGWGTGSRSSWLVPVWDQSSLALRVGSLTLAVNSHFVVSSHSGSNSMSILTVSSYNPGGYPPANFPVECDYVDGFYLPIVRLREVFQYSLRVGFDLGEIALSFAETKETYPSS
jgi:phage-related protein